MQLSISDAMIPILESGPNSLKISRRNPVAALAENRRTTASGTSCTGNPIPAKSLPRLVVKDEKSICKEEIEEIEGVKGVFIAQGQLQIIFGTGVVNRVYEEFVAVSGIETATKEDVKAAAGQKMNPFKKAIKVLGDIFVPIIPAIVATGLLMGLLEGFSTLFPAMANSDTYKIFHMFSNTMMS